MKTKKLTIEEHKHIVALMRIKYRIGGWEYAMDYGRTLYKAYTAQKA